MHYINNNKKEKAAKGKSALLEEGKKRFASKPKTRTHISPHEGKNGKFILSNTGQNPILIALLFKSVIANNIHSTKQRSRGYVISTCWQTQEWRAGKLWRSKDVTMVMPLFFFFLNSHPVQCLWCPCSSPGGHPLSSPPFPQILLAKKTEHNKLLQNSLHWKKQGWGKIRENPHFFLYSSRALGAKSQSSFSRADLVVCRFDSLWSGLKHF